MSLTREQILAEAKALRPEDREALAEELWLTLDPRDREEIDTDWADEIERRIEAYDGGEAPAAPPDEMFRRLREKYRP
jgi:putative addiction module component (TIGR02574 family)